MIHPAYQRAQLLYAQGRFDLAAGALRQMLGEEPQDAHAHALLGLCLVHQKKYEEASAEAGLAIHAAPDDPFGHYASGAIFQERNRFAEAEAAAREAIRLSGGTGHAEYWSLLGQALFSSERWGEALEAANHGLGIDPADLGSVNLRAMALVKLGDKQAATATMAGALQKNPHSAATHANQGWALLHQGNHKQALEHFREALRLNPNLEWAKSGMVEALKARYFLYRMMLRYYLWMSRFTRRGQWGMIIGLWVGVQVLQLVQAQHPAAAPYVIPVLVAYVVFVLAGWLASPIFNLTLLGSKYGRYLLSRADAFAAIAVGGLLFGGIALFIIGIVQDSVLIPCGILMGLLSLSAAAAGRMREKTLLGIMWGYTGALAALGFAAIFAVGIQTDYGINLFQIAIWGSVLSGLAANVAGTMIRKK